MEIIWHIEQGSPEWMELRLGIITCSEMSAIRSDGAGAYTYINELAFERLTGESSSVFEDNNWTKRGHELEPVARQMYEKKTGLEVSMVSFIKNKGFGYSPDGLIFLDSDKPVGGLEIKAKQPSEQMHILRSNEIPKKHLDQLHGGLSCAELDWIDFVSYCPSLPLFVKRVYSKDCLDKIKNIESLVEKYNIQIDEAVNQIAEMY